jgi:hypothetical protein
MTSKISSLLRPAPDRNVNTACGCVTHRQFTAAGCVNDGRGYARRLWHRSTFLWCRDPAPSDAVKHQPSAEYQNDRFHKFYYHLFPPYVVLPTQIPYRFRLIAHTANDLRSHTGRRVSNPSQPSALAIRNKPARAANVSISIAVQSA